MATEAKADDRQLFQVWYYDGDGANTSELVMLTESEVPYVQQMFEHLYGDMGEVVVAPMRHVQSLAELIDANQYDPEEWE